MTLECRSFPGKYIRKSAYACKSVPIILSITAIGFVVAVIKSPYWCYKFKFLYALFGNAETGDWKDRLGGWKRHVIMLLPSIWRVLKSETTAKNDSLIYTSVDAGIVARDGVAGLYRGFVPNALKSLPNSRFLGSSNPIELRLSYYWPCYLLPTRILPLRFSILTPKVLCFHVISFLYLRFFLWSIKLTTYDIVKRLIAASEKEFQLITEENRIKHKNTNKQWYWTSNSYCFSRFSPWKFWWN